MKPIHSTIYLWFWSLLMTAISCSAQTDQVPGLIKKATVFNKKDQLSEIRFFDRNGKKVRNEYFEPDGSLYRIRNFTYNSAGELLLKIDSISGEFEKNVYDERNRLLYAIEGNNFNADSLIYTYDDVHQRKLLHYSYQSGYVTYLLNEHGNPVKSWAVSETGDTVSISQSTYNADQLLLSHKYTDADGYGNGYIKTYDSKGNNTSVKRINADGSLQSASGYDYDNFGRIIAIRELDEQGKLKGEVKMVYEGNTKTISSDYGYGTYSSREVYEYYED